MLNIVQVQVYKDKTENPDLIDGFVPDAYDDDITTRAYNGKTVHPLGCNCLK